MCHSTRLLLVVIGLCLTAASPAADWPQFRYDAGRSAYSPESLPESLHLRWVRQLPAPRPAFPGEVRLRFDASYEPVVLGNTLFVPSMVTDSVTAIDTASGEVRWEFFAEGPIRFAPAAAEGRVYFVSDDGYLYCLDAASGQLQWKSRHLPPGQQDRQLLANGRLVSLRPARGGPVVRDGVVYYGAGIWSGYEVCVNAVDAQSGALLWSNNDSNQIPKANMDHGIANFAGLTPQGYLAIVDGRLVVPCGAQLPAFLNLKTGEVDEYCMGWGGREGLPKGTWFVAGTRHYLSHGGDLYDIRRRNDEEFADNVPLNNFKPMLYAGRFTRVSIDPTNQKDLGDFDQPVFDNDTMYVNDQGVIAYDISDVRLEERGKSEASAIRKTDRYPDKWQAVFRERWRLSTPLEVQLRAGNHLFLGGRGTIESVRVPPADETPRVVWSTTLDGTPQRMVAANGTLFVVTTSGHIYAYGAAAAQQPKTHAVPAPAEQPADDWTKIAADLLQAAQAHDGYALVLRIGSGRLVRELVRQSSLHVIVIDGDAARIDQYRHELQAAGLYGTRVAVKVGDPLQYPLPPYFANLVASEDWQALRGRAPRDLATYVFRALRPYGGTACLALSEASRKELVGAVSAKPIEQARMEPRGDWLLISRPQALADAGSWTHEEADAANTGASAERFAKPPLELLWFDGPPRWIRTLGASLVRVCGGRMFIKATELDAIDVFTGRPLWEAKFSFPHAPTDQFVALEDQLYVTHERTCVRLDSATGKVLGEITLPENHTAAWANLRGWDKYLVGQSGSHVLCFDRHTGALLWDHACDRGALSLAVGNGEVFCAEVPNRNRGESEDETTIYALETATGRLLWKSQGGGAARFSETLDAVVCASGIYRAADGSRPAAMPQVPVDPNAKPDQQPHPLFVIGNRLLFGTAESFAIYDLTTTDTLKDPLAWVRRGCTRPRASAAMVTTRYRGNAACVDLATFEIIPFWNVRAACSNNLFPADGVLNMPSLTGGCTCNYLPISQAFVPASAIAASE